MICIYLYFILFFLIFCGVDISEVNFVVCIGVCVIISGFGIKFWCVLVIIFSKVIFILIYKVLCFR